MKKEPEKFRAIINELQNPLPIKYPDNVDKRRGKMGLETFAKMNNCSI